MKKSDENAVCPTVICADPFNFGPCSLTVEGSTYPVQDSIAAVLTAFELCWVFHMKHSPPPTRTLTVLEHFFGLSNNKNGVLVSRHISDLAALCGPLEGDTGSTPNTVRD